MWNLFNTFKMKEVILFWLMQCLGGFYNFEGKEGKSFAVKK